MSRALPRSATTIALLADVPSTGHLGGTQARRFPLSGQDLGERSAAFVDFALERVSAGEKVIALYPRWRDKPAERAIAFARGALRTDHIAGVPMDHPPLALSLIADQLAYLAPYLPAGVVAALCEELPRHLLAGAWLKTVSNLSTLPTSVRQHLGSYAPGVSFLAYSAPVRRVGRLRPDRLAQTLPFRPVDPVQLLYSTPDPAISTVFDTHLPPVIQPVAARALPAQPLGPRYWGTSKYVEFVALSAHPQALAYAANSIRPSECGWCAEPLTAPVCPFCCSTTVRRPRGGGPRERPAEDRTRGPAGPRPPSGPRLGQAPPPDRSPTPVPTEDPPAEDPPPAEPLPPITTGRRPPSADPPDRRIGGAPAAGPPGPPGPLPPDLPRIISR